ncbi:hypothetical protein OSTOST_01726 [Ostertagia ostertagi]
MRVWVDLFYRSSTIITRSIFVFQECVQFLLTLISTVCRRKASSVVLYKNKEYLHNQYFCDADWQGGIYASSTLEGSRSGLNIALCWASLLYQGFDKYKQHSRAVVATTKKIRDGITSIPELRLQGSSDVCIVSLDERRH